MTTQINEDQNETAAATPKGPLDIVLEFTAGVIGQPHPERVQELLHPDVVAYLPVSLEPEPFRGREQLMAFFQFAAGVFVNDQVRYDVTHTAVNDDIVFLALEVTARFRTLDADYHNYYCFRYTVREGLIVEYREYTDSKYAAGFEVER